MEISSQRLQIEFNPLSLLESEKYKLGLLVALGILESLAVYPPCLRTVRNGLGTFWMVRATTKPCTFIENWKIQLSEDACRFSVTLSYQTILLILWIVAWSFPRSLENYEKQEGF